MKTLRWLILLIPAFLQGQVLLDFEGASLEGWIQVPGDRWEISSEGVLKGSFSMHHSYDNPQPGVDLAFYNVNYPDLTKEIGFRFRIRHSYNPSSGNNWQVILFSGDTSDLINCFVFGVNFTGSDDQVKLWQVLEGEVTEILNTGVNYESLIGRDLAPLFSVTRSPSGNWNAAMDPGGNYDALTGIGSGQEAGVVSGKFIGVRYSYSSAQDRKLWLDDIKIEGEFFEDRKAPAVDYIEILGLQGINIEFNETVRTNSQTFFRWEGSSPDSIRVAERSIQLYFSHPFPNRMPQQLEIHAIVDRDGNILRDTVVVFFQNIPEYGEVVINEIMSDPEPNVYLPPCEYIELYNNSPYRMDLTNWSLAVHSKRYYLLSEELLPGEYLILTGGDKACSYDLPHVQPIFSSSASIPNNGTILQLFEANNRLVHTHRYSNGKEHDPVKGEGGWSQEQVDPDLECGWEDNWEMSKDPKGGTPGRVNSVISEREDFEVPIIKHIGISDSTSLLITFSEPVFLDTVNQSNFTLDDQGELQLDAVTSPLVADEIHLSFNNSLSDETIYSLKVDQVSDCEGNIINSITIPFALPVLPAKGQVILNEVMYDPVFGQEEYVELHNVSQQYIDLRDLKMGIPGVSGKYSVVQISEASHLLAPGRYIALAESERNLRRQWQLPREMDVVAIQGWKKLGNESETMLLFNRSEQLLEHFTYHDSMHHDLLQDPSGVALERLPGKSDRWLSASSSVGYGTPAERNSHYSRDAEPKEEMTVYPQVISPDMDGYHDIAEIMVPSGSLQSYVTIVITDLMGGVVLKLVEKAISGSSNVYYWDGHDRSGHLVLPGLYVVHAEVVSNGRSRIYRRSCAVK